MSLPTLYREAPCVFLDCDGVIFDSNGFKLEAMRYALSGYPEPALREMDAYWSANGGVSRYEKLAYFFDEILKSDDVASRVAAAAARFTEFSRRAYGECRPLPEALSFAQQTGAERCFVVSGTDQDELRDVFAAKQLSTLFSEVCGSPTSKLAHLQRILEQRACPAERALFIGDGGGDFEVARRLNMPFIYINRYSEWREAAATLSRAPGVVAICETWTDISAVLDAKRLLTEA
jgi:phosphoglycolate phosphatase-like HAD superfamily hydrolase